ncbi:MAG TPA: amidase [Acidimicrobiia bacterium]
MTDDLAWLDATAQAELVRAGDATPGELLDAAIARIEKLDPELNAVIHPLFEQAAAAASAPRLPDGPFRGVPFLVKDAVCHTAGDPYHLGMRVLKEAGWTEAEDTELARRFRAAGFIVCGKTNVPELAMSVTTEPLAYGPTRNPWDTGRSPGGSSGGAAAAVASGMVPVAHGNDMGGSIRFPSAMCGLVGLKPTRARTTLAPDYGEYWGPLTHEHVLTRSVRDSAGVLDAVRGPAPGDPYTAPPPARPYGEEVGADAGRMRIGYRTRRLDGEESHPDCVAAVEATARLLESLGHDVEPAGLEALDRPELGAGLGLVMGAVIARELDRWSERLGRTIDPSELEPTNTTLAEMGAGVTAPRYLAAIEAMQSWSRGVAAWWAAGNDVLLTPTSPEPPVPLGELRGDAPEPFEVLVRMGALTTFMGAFDVTGQPAMSVPLHWNGDGLPIGVQLVAAYGREDVLFRLAAQLEQAQPWAGRRPPVSA